MANKKRSVIPSNPDAITETTPVDESAVQPTPDATDTPAETTPVDESAVPVEPAAEQAATQGEPDMACANCGDNTPLPNAFNETTANATKREDGFVQLKFTGGYEGPVTYFGLYDGCISCPPVWADPNDVARLLNTGVWAVVEAAPPDPVA
jgi:hypothetical protein